MAKILYVVVVIVMVVSPLVEAETSCNNVMFTLYPCLDYVTNGGTQVPADCCSGIMSVYSDATTASDRQSVCSCLKILAASAPASSIGNAASLPDKCGIPIPYKISPSTDCSKVQ